MTERSYICPHCGKTSYNLNDANEGYCGFCHRWRDEAPAKALHSDPTPGQRITQLHCWVATYADGSEGIVAGGVEGIGMTPLMSSRRHVAVALGPVARRAVRTVQQQAGHATKIRLVTFRSVEGDH